MKKTALFLATSAIILGGCTLPGAGSNTGTSFSLAPQTGSPSGPTTPTATSNAGLTAGNQITLTVNTPKSGTVVSSPALTVSGKTVAGADVSVNDNNLKADAQGNFSSKIMLDKGENVISVVANDANGNSSEQEITVTYNAPGY